jgi:site-specific DNA recombinase
VIAAPSLCTVTDRSRDKSTAVPLNIRVFVYILYITEARMKTLAVGYVRVSTAGQAAEGVSLEAQRARIEAWAKVQGVELLAVHVDAGLSGSKADNRPALQAALAQACRKRAALVVYSLSRLARSTSDALAIFGRLGKAGADLVSLTESIDTTTASGKMIFGVLSVLNEFERDLIAERTRTALAHLRGQGRRVSGRAPYGYAFADGAVVPDVEEQGVVEEIRTLRALGLSVRKIAVALDEKGVPTRGAASWRPNLVHSILRRPQIERAS